jgi:hypothetical protein
MPCSAHKHCNSTRYLRVALCGGPLHRAPATAACRCSGRGQGCVTQSSARCVPAGSTHIGDSVHRCWGKQRGLSGNILGERCGAEEVQLEILGLVQQANLALNMTNKNNECPYKEKHCAGLPYAKPTPGRAF